MGSHETAGRGHSRRTVLAGVGSVGALSIAGISPTSVSAAEIEEQEVDPYTRATYRAIADAIVPETPGLDDELGPEHVPGGLDVSLEEFLLYGLNHFHEIQAESVADDAGFQFDEGVVIEHVDTLINGATSGVERMLELAGFEDAEDVFGAFEEMETEVLGANDDTGAAQVAVTMETSDGTASRVTETYPYAELFAVIFDLVAAEFVVRERNDDELGTEGDFPPGGLFTQLSRRDRLRCLDSIIDGGLLATVDDVVGKILPTVGILKFGVMALHGLTVIGHYSEWAGYGETRAEPPNDRELEVPQDEVLGHRQAEFPGLEPGYAAHRGVAVDAFVENEWEDHFEDDDDDDWDWGWDWGWS